MAELTDGDDDAPRFLPPPARLVVADALPPLRGEGVLLSVLPVVTLSSLFASSDGMLF